MKNSDVWGASLWKNNHRQGMANCRFQFLIELKLKYMFLLIRVKTPDLASENRQGSDILCPPP